MADFHQHGLITTLHQLRQRPLEDLENELIQISRRRPMALILPSLYSELQGPALGHILDELAAVPYLAQIVVGLDRANEAEYRHALEFFGRLPQKPQVLWNDGPRLRAIRERLADHGLSPQEPGKGRNVWSMFGYILASGEAEAIALHDCDITTYSREMVARLLYPVAHPGFSYRFCKGYYARIANGSMNGRVCRLLVTPLLRALRTVCGSSPYLEFLDSFRYPLAGEFSLRRDVIEDVRIPSDWGLEMGVLSEMHRNYATNQICQIDIADNYDHKHQDLSLEDRTRGLSRMSYDIARSLFRKMATQGQVFTLEQVRTIKATYYRIALDLVDSYHNDATTNGLRYDRHKEGSSVEAFAENVLAAGADFLDVDRSMEAPFMPSWKRVRSAVPDIYDQILRAVADDTREHGSEIVLNPALHPQAQRLRQRVVQHTGAIYGEARAHEVADQVLAAAELTDFAGPTPSTHSKWSENDVVLITYGDSIRRVDQAPLATLGSFLRSELHSTVSTVHVLPFFPSSSDDGFSVIDYEKVEPALGTWRDLEAVSEDFRLMADLVLNHCSRSSTWFHNHCDDKEPGRGYFLDASEFDDLSQVVRPRATPLANEVEVGTSRQRLWCTFSADQLDLDFRNPQVLVEFVRLVKLYIERGVSYFRLDAVAFVWKEDGTDCLHRPQTHEIVKLLRLIAETLEPSVVVITETNVPNRENLSYFGNDNEAHLVYNFSLPPLLVHALLEGDCQHLMSWMASMPPARRGRGYLNFLASHDGIGLRPTEGLLSDGERNELVDALRSFGGEISMRQLADGSESAYEANISLWDALQGTISGGRDELQMERYLCAHTVLLALEGIPALYIHSLLSTPNDHEAMERSGIPRRINRSKLSIDEIERQLTDHNTTRSQVFRELTRRIRIRRRQPAFHPNATQYTLQFGNEIFAFWRESLGREQNIFALHNVTGRRQRIPLMELNLIATDTWHDLLSDTRYEDLEATLELPPYGCVWIANQG